MIPSRPLTLASLLAGLVFSASHAQQPSASAEPTPAQQEAQEKALREEVEGFGWTRQGVGKLGSMAQIAIPSGYRFTDGAGASKMLEFYGNPPSEKYLGMLATEDFNEHSILFRFDDTGYIKDDEKDSLDADSMLKSIQEGTKAGNEQRRQLGLEELETVGWAVPPRYNDKTNNLEWATKLRSLRDGSVTVNHNTRLLGRHGVMRVTLLCSPSELAPLLPRYQELLTAFQYIDGERYAQFDSRTDKIAKYGLTGLVAGTGAFAAAKMGLFAKLGGLIAKMGKLVIVAVLALLAGFKAIFSKIFGRGQNAVR
jgi:uncharacterized membrane-anchored protein